MAYHSTVTLPEIPRFCEENGFYTTPATSRQMSRIRSKNTKPELLLRRALHGHGFRFRIHDRSLPGTPDISIRKYRIAVFVDGEFWHGYDWEKRKEQVKTNRGFWIPKIERNMLRDRWVEEQLQKEGFTVVRFWQRDVQKNLGACVHLLLSLTAPKQEPSAFFYPETDY